MNRYSVILPLIVEVEVFIDAENAEESINKATEVALENVVIFSGHKDVYIQYWDVSLDVKNEKNCHLEVDVEQIDEEGNDDL